MQKFCPADWIGPNMYEERRGSVGEISIMQSVVRFLEQFDFYVTRSSEENLPYEACIVNFGVDQKERPVTVQVMSYTQEAAASLIDVEVQPSPTKMSVLMFIMTNPAPIPEKNVQEVFRLMALTNKVIPLGAINYSEMEKATYYTYSAPLFEEPPSDLSLMAILHTAIFVRETLFPIIDELASGASTLEDVLQTLVPEQQTLSRTGM
jgi:hypothetical protein